MAGNISLGSNSPIESGQGVSLYAACAGSTQITLKPAVTFVNGNPGAFKFSSFDVSNVPVGCQGTDFQFAAYGDTGTAVTLFDSTGKNVNVYNNAGTFEANVDTGFTVTNLSSGSFRVTFTSPAAMSTDIYKFTLQSGLHVAYASVNSWASTAGTTTSGQFIYDSAMDSSGNVYSLTYSAEMRINGTTYSGGGQGTWITKSNSQGSFLWTKSIMSSEIVYPQSITLDASGNIYVSGAYSGTLTVGSSTLTNTGNLDGYVAKLDSSGNGIWANKIAGTAMDYVMAVAVDSANNVAVTGFTESNSLSVAGQTFTKSSARDVFVAKYDSSGGSLWAVQGTTPADQNQGTGIVIDGSNNIYVSGNHTGTFTLGTVTKSGNGSSDAYVAKINSSGTVQWIANPGSTASENLYQIAVDGSGNLYAAVEYVASFSVASTSVTNSGGIDVAVIKYNSSGVAQWVRTIAGTGNQLAHSVKLDGSGNVWVTGRYQNSATSGSYSLTSIGGYDAYVFRFSSSGTAEYAKSVGSGNNDVSGGVHIKNGYFYLVGEYAGSITFEGTTISSGSSSDRDIFVVAFKY